MSTVYVGLVLAVAGAGLSAYSAAQQASAIKDQKNYQAAISRNNAKIAEWQRSLTLQDAEVAANKRTREAADLLGRQRLAIAANGLALNEGSPLDLQATTQFYKQEDVASIQSDAARRAWGYEVEGQNLTTEGNFNQYLADRENPTASAAIAGGSSLLSSAASYSSSQRTTTRNSPSNPATPKTPAVKPTPKSYKT